MKMLLHKIIFTILAMITLFSAFSSVHIATAQVEHPILTISINENQLVVNSEIDVRILVSSTDLVNAFDLILQYPSDYLEFVRASTKNSIATVWQSLPPKIVNDSIRLTGGMIEPFSGSGEIITLVFRTKKIGEVDFSMQKTDFVFYDGVGTIVVAPEVKKIVSISENDRYTSVEYVQPIPEIYKIDVVRDSLEKVTLVTVKTKDDGMIEDVYIRSRKWILWSDWQKTQLLAAVPDGAWAIQASVMSWGGNLSSDVVVYRWEIIVTKILIIAVVVFVVLYVRKLLNKK